MATKAITKQQAIVDLGITEWMVDDFAKRGYPPLGIKPRFRVELNASSRPRYWFPRSELERMAEHRKQASIPANNDLVPIGHVLKNPFVTKKRTYKFTKKSLYRWIGRCLFLGRPLTHEYLGARQTLCVSRIDLETIARMLDNPFGWQLPGNSGVWLANGIYRDEGELWFGLDCLEQFHQIGNSLWLHWARAGHPSFPLEANGGKPRSKEPKWPTRKNVHGGVMLVIHDKDVERILDWRKVTSPTAALPGVQGSWLSEELFRDDDGLLWATNKWIQESKGKSEIFPRYWNERGLLPKKRIGRRSKIRSASRRVLVYSMDKLDNLLQRGAADPGATVADPKRAETPTPRRHPGRKRGWRDPRAKVKHNKIIDAWKSGQHQSISELARKMGHDRTLISKVLKKAGICVH